MILLKKGYTLYAIAGTSKVINCTVYTNTTILFSGILQSSLIQICKADISDVEISEIQLINTSASLVENVNFYTRKTNSSIDILTSSVSVLSNGNTTYANNEWKILDSAGITTVNITPTPTYITKIDTSITDLTYIGKTLPNTLDSESLWQIKLIEESSGSVTILFADGSDDFINVWDDRLTYTYS